MQATRTEALEADDALQTLAWLAKGWGNPNSYEPRLFLQKEIPLSALTTSTGMMSEQYP